MSVEQPVRILIVEDEVLTAHAITSDLKNLGYAVIGFVRSGEEAIKMASRTQPDVVLMDIKLKGLLDGVSATHRIQTGLDIPVIYLTASSDAETVKRAIHSSPYGYITKPFRKKDLRDAIRNALDQKKAKRDMG